MAALGSANAGCTYFGTLFDPVVLAARAVSVSVDARGKEEVADDVAIEASCQTRLLRDDQAEWAGVTPLVFARHPVLVGTVKSALARRRAEQLMREDPRIRSLANELVVIRKPGDGGNFVEDRADRHLRRGIDQHALADGERARGVDGRRPVPARGQDGGGENPVSRRREIRQIPSSCRAAGEMRRGRGRNCPRCIRPIPPHLQP
jgi:hypothetical protein